MLFYNKKMKKLLDKIESHNFKVYNKKITIKNLIALLEPKFLKIDSCIIFDTKPNKKTLKLDMKKVIRDNYNETEFEVSHNELKIEHYIENYPKPKIDILWFTLKVINYWENELKKQFPKYHFTISVIYSSDGIDARFYRQRDGEFWLEEEALEEYPNAILLRKF